MNGLGNNERKRFLGIANGKVTYRPGKNEDRQEFDYVTGTLKEIQRRDAEINGEKLKFYDFIIMNGTDTYALSLPMGGGVARSIVLSLANVKSFRGAQVKINPYTKSDGQKDYTNVAVYVNGEKVGWVTTDIPKSKPVTAGSKTFYDDSERVAMVEAYVDKINGLLHQNYDNETGKPVEPVVDYEQEEERTAPEPGSGPEVM